MENLKTDNQTRPQIIVARTQKSAGISIILTILFGSLGLFYSTISGGLIITFLFAPGLFVILAMGHYIAAILLALAFYPICIIWGVRAVNKYNDKLMKGEDTTESFEYSTYDIVMFLLMSAFAFCAIYAIADIFFK